MLSDEIPRRRGGSFEVEVYKDWKEHIKMGRHCCTFLPLWGRTHRIKDIPKDNLLVIVGAGGLDAKASH